MAFASELLQEFAFQQLSRAVMATTNSITGMGVEGADSASGSANAESSIFGVMRRQWGKVQDVLQGITAPLKRRSMYDELPEHFWPEEHIELADLPNFGRGRGHNFLPCELPSSTWCDFCGQFIWGVSKRCMRCQHCQYTCHQLCVPSVNLNCKTISDDGDDVTHTKAQAERKGSLETSLSQGIHARPGAAKVISRGASEDGTSCTLAAQHLASESTPNLQQIGRHQQRAMPTSQPIIESLADALGYDCLDVSDLPKLPPPPSAIDELTVDNDDSRFITHGQHLHHRHSLPHAPTYSPISEEDQREAQNAKSVSSSTWTMTKTFTATAAGHPSSVSTSTSADASQKSSLPRESTPPKIQKAADSETPCQAQIIHEGVKLEGEAHAEEKDETDSGYRSGTIPDEKLPKVPSQATLDRQDLKRKITKYNHFVPTVHLEMTDKESFQGFLKVCMNLIRPITMELGARPPSIYELLTKEHIIEENTQQVAFYMPRDTYKSLHISSETTTKELISLLLKKFHILDHPRKFAMYEQEFSDNNKLVRLRRLGDKDHPLCAALAWNPERFHNYRMVLQENETGEIVWDAFSLPELNNFLKVLDREEKETIMELRHKYAYMRQLMEKRLIEFRGGKRHSKVKSTSQA